MSDEPFYTPGKKPTPQPHYRPQLTERLWEIRKDHVTWSCDLRFHGESYGWEALILRDGELFVSQRFVLKAAAAQWANDQHADIDKGRIDSSNGNALSPARSPD
jgi:hypothetical protein